jgi:hypothetical protein
LEVDEAKLWGGSGGRGKKGLWNFREGPWELFTVQKALLTTLFHHFWGFLKPLGLLDEALSRAG